MTTTKRRLFHGYQVLLSTFLLKFVAIGAFNSSGLYLGPLSTSFPNCNGGYLAFYCTIQLASGLASSFVGGTLQEVLEAHNIGFQWLFFGGGVFMTFGLLISSYSINITILLVGALFTGVGVGLCGFLAGGICVLWFEEHRGTMLLLAMSGEGIGNIFFSWLTAKLLEVFGSMMSNGDGDDAWRPVMRCVAVLSFILCSVASTSMRLPVSGEVEEHEKNQRKIMLEATTTATSYADDDDDDNGQQTTVLKWEESDDDDDDNPSSYEYGAVNTSRSLSENDVAHNHHHMHINMKRTRASIIEKERKNPLTMIATYEALGEAHLIPKRSPPHRPSKRLGKQRFMAAVNTVMASQRFGKAIADADDEEEEDEDEPTLSLGEVALSQTNIWLCAFSFISCFSILNLQVLLASYTSSLGMLPSVGGHVLSMCGGGILFSNLSLGPVADSIGSRRLLTLSFFGISILFFVWPHCITTTSMSVLAFSYGYLVCTMSSLPVIILADAYGLMCSERVLALNGITNIFKFPGYLLGPSVAGMLIERGGYNLAGIVSGLITLAGTATLLLIPSPAQQQIELLEIKRRSKEQRINGDGV
jgi:MFS family permease